MSADSSEFTHGAGRKSAWLRPYLAAIVLVLVAWLVQATFGPEFGEVFAFLPFVVATILTSLLGGLRQTIVATVLGFVLASWLYVTRGRAEGEEAVFTITDNGVGMPAELIPHVFDLFAQGDRTLDRADGGLGIGLTLVRRITEMHGGSVSAASDGTGQGSTFTIRLPLQTRHMSQLAESPDQQPIDGGSKRVLVVDDNVDGARTLELLLKSAGHEVATCHTGSAALAAVQAFLPDVVLLDIGLPGKDGFQVALDLRADSKLCRSAIFALSGYGQDTDQDRARAAGFDEYLVKPIDFQYLRAAIGKFPGNSGPM